MSEDTLKLLDSIFQPILPILQFVILIYPFKNKKAFFDLRRTTLPSFLRFSTKGFIFILYGLILALLTFFQSRVTKNIEEIESAKIVKYNKSRDSINQARSEASNLKVTELLAKYGLKIDDKNEEIVKILNDPNQRKTTIINGETPLLDISDIKINDTDDTVFTFDYTSYDATSYDINVKLDVLAKINERIVLIKKDMDVLPPNAVIKKEQGLQHVVRITNTSSYNFLLFRLHGQIKKNDNSIIPIESISGYDKNEKNKKFGYPKISTINQIKEFYKEHNLK